MEAAFATVYERNLFYQQVSFKWRSFLHLRTNVGALQWARKGWLRDMLFTIAFCFTHLLDFVFGCGLLMLVVRYNLQERLGVAISTYTLTMLQWTEQLVQWLMGYPGGLKLNSPLDHFLGTRFLTILHFWEYFYLDFIAHHLTSITSLIFLLAPFGVTFSLAALHDFLKFLNLCLICFFIFSNRIFMLQVSALKSLARLFMGKKWNVLRKRVDSCNYDTSQLLMGTVLFTILLFLLPTTGMYFLIFLLLRLLQFSVQFAVRLATVAANNVTAFCWRKLQSKLSDPSISSVNIVYSHSMQRRQTDSANVRILWNGRKHTVRQIQEIVLLHSTSRVLQEVCSSSGPAFEHTMLKFTAGVWPL